MHSLLRFAKPFQAHRHEAESIYKTLITVGGFPPAFLCLIPAIMTLAAILFVISLAPFVAARIYRRRYVYIPGIVAALVFLALAGAILSYVARRRRLASQRIMVPTTSWGGTLNPVGAVGVPVNQTGPPPVPMAQNQGQGYPVNPPYPPPVNQGGGYGGYPQPWLNSGPAPGFDGSQAPQFSPGPNQYIPGGPPTITDPEKAYSQGQPYQPYHQPQAPGPPGF